MAESAEEKKIGDENEANGLERDGSPKGTGGEKPGKPEKPGKAVTFSPEQITLINAMFEERLKGEKSSRGPNGISMYALRDPKSIETIRVSRFDGKWVIGYKDLQTDPYKKTVQYLRYGVDPIRKLFNEPFITLLLTSDGKKIEEKEVMLITYMDNRERENPICKVKVMEVKSKPVIHDHGILGSGGTFAVAIDEKGKPENRPTILAQSKSVELSFVAQPEGFKEPYEFSSDFLS